MAAITRRTWADLLIEIKRRAGGINYSASGGNPSSDDRLRMILYEAYLYLSLRYGHFEMHRLDSTITTSTSVNTITVPTDLYVPIMMVLRSGTTFKGAPAADSFYKVIREYRASPAGVPTSFARFQTKFYFNKLPDAAYAIDLYYYKVPAAPDFAVATPPETAWELDEYLIQATLANAFQGLFRADLAEVNRQSLAQHLAEEVRDHLAASPQADRREVENSNRPLGGAAA